MASKSERFGRLFRGFELRHGRYDVTEQSDSGKMVGNARTLDAAISGDDYKAHLNGEYGIGVIPLTNDNRVHFAAIDIDDYQNRTPEFYAKATSRMHALVTRSKSGGTHVWIFSKEGLPAALAVKLLKQWAANLGVANSEIFPKQVKRSSSKDAGNWINLPYFHGRKAVLTRLTGKSDDSVEVYDGELDDFLTAAEALAEVMTEKHVQSLIENAKSQRDTDKSTALPDWHDGPYCLQRLFAGFPKAKDEQLHEPALTEGGRNTAFFNAAVYLSRKYEGDETRVTNVLNEVNVKNNLGFPLAELQICVKSAMKKDWGFQCKQPPLSPMCNRAACLKRRYGIGSRGEDTNVDISDLVKVKTEPPLYIMNADGERVEIDGDELLNQRLFTRRVMDATSKVIPVMQDQKYRDFVQLLLDRGVEIDGPPDTDPETIITGELINFIDQSRVPRKDKIEYAVGAVYVDENDEHAWFHRSDFTKYLQKQRVTFDSRKVSDMLLNVIGCVAKSTTINGRSVRVWVAPLGEIIDTVKEE